MAKRQRQAVSKDQDLQSQEVGPDTGNSNAAALARVRATALAVKADDFSDSTLGRFQAGLDALDGDAVESAGLAISVGWAQIDQEDDAVEDAVGDLAALGESTDPTALPEVAASRKAVRKASYEIGVKATSQVLHGEALLGSVSQRKTGEDIPGFVAEEVAKAKKTLDLAVQIADILKAPEVAATDTEEATTSPAQDTLVGALGMMAETRLEQKFIWAVLNLQGVLPQYLAIHDGSKVMRDHKKRLDAEAAITNDQQIAVDPDELAQMRSHADQIESEVKSRMGANALVITMILARYETPEKLDLFFGVLERRNLVDAMLSKGDTDFVKGKLAQTTKYRGRTYVESADVSQLYSLSDNAGEIAGEMAKQSPGAIAKMAGGVFGGLGHLPVVGKYARKVEKNFDDLAGAADEITGASAEGRKWRNLVAKGTGQVVSMLAQGGVGAESGLARAAQVANAGKKATDTYTDARAIVDDVMAFKAIYDDGKVFWGTVMDLQYELPGLISSIGRMDAPSAVAHVDTVCAGLITSVGGWAKTKVTLKGKKKAAKEAQQAADRTGDSKLAADFFHRGQVIANNPNAGIEDVVELHAASGKLEGAVSRRANGPVADRMAPKPGRIEALDVAVGDGLKAALVDIAVLLIQKLRETLKAAILDAVSEPTESLVDAVLDDRPDWKDKFISFLEGSAPTIAKGVVAFGLKKLNAYASGALTKLVGRLIRKRHPDFGAAIEPALKDGIKKLLAYAQKELDLARLLEAPLAAVIHGLGRSVLAMDSKPSIGETLAGADVL